MPHPSADTVELLQLVEAVFARMPERDARVVSLHQLAGLERHALAREFETAPAAVSVRRSKELAKSAG